MKKWFTEASAFCGHGRSNDKETGPRSEIEKCDELSNGDHNANGLSMGLNVSCAHPESQPHIDGETFESTSPHHGASTSCQSASPHSFPFNDIASPACTGHVTSNSHYSLNRTSKSFDANPTDTKEVSSCTCPGLPLLNNPERLSINLSNEPSTTPSSSVDAPIYRVEVESLSPISSQPLHSNDICESDTESQYAASNNTSDIYRVNWNSNPIYGNSLCSSNGSSRFHLRDNSDSHSSSLRGCGHFCTMCQVKVQVEVECVPKLARPSSSANKRGIKNIPFSKRTRHKSKTSCKDHASTSKKRKTSWSFPFKGALRQGKNSTESNSATCSCCCVHSKHSNRPIEPNPNCHHSNFQREFPCNNLHGDLPHMDSNLSEIDDVAAANETSEAIFPPPGFASFVNTNSVALSLTYNSVLDLRDLLDRSLRLGLGGPRRDNSLHLRDRVLHRIGHIVSEIPQSVHTQVDYIHCLVPDLLNITNCASYWGKMDRYEADRLLDNRPEGTFLLRDSAQEEHLFSVSFRRYGRSLHARIEQLNHKFSFDSHDPGVFASSTVCGLIEHYKDPSCCLFFEPLLTLPLSRTFPFPLQHLCRATICSQVTYDGISKLPAPKKLMTYLKEYHYKQRVRVRHLD